MRRRDFNAVMSGAGIVLSQGNASALGVVPEVLQLSRNGWMPNNEHLPVLLYRSAISVVGEDPAALFEKRFEQNGWPSQWRNGVYDFHHYHSTAHEVLGFAGGHAMLMLGGERGHEIEVQAGDVVVLPTGTGHCKLEATFDFLVIGAYPPTQHFDVCRKAPSKEALARMRDLPFPATDPISGAKGPLRRIWKAI